MKAMNATMKKKDLRNNTKRKHYNCRQDNDNGNDDDNDRHGIDICPATLAKCVDTASHCDAERASNPTRNDST